MIGYTAKLTYAGYSLDLSSGRYSLGEFIPPTASEVVTVASGLSSNRMQGSSIASRRGVNTDFSFSIRIMGASIAETDAGKNDIVNMLRLAGNENEPLYFDYCPHGYVTYAPKWGQDQWRRLVIVYGYVSNTFVYNAADVRSKAQVITVSCQIKPYAYGIKQRLATAIGGVFEDYLGYAPGLARGVRVPEATTNLADNPVFGNATYSTEWTAGSAVTAAANYDRRFILFGRTSVKLVSNHASANNQYYQSLTLTVATHTASAYVKKADGSAVTASDIVIYETDGGDTASAYQNIGNGWYRVYASWTGVASAKNIGVSLKAVGAGLYLAAFQVEAKAYPTAFCYGDMMGVAWSGTAHAASSTSARTAASLGVDTYDTVTMIEGTVRACLEMDCDNTCGTFTVFQTYAASALLDCYYNSSDDKFYFTDGTNTISTAAQTWSVGDKIILHVTWKTGALAIYKAGASVASGATYTPPALGTTLYIGSQNDATENLRGIVLGFDVWDRAMSSGEVANDYANVYQIATDGGRVSCIPWLYNGASMAFGNHLAAAGGIPGNVDADTTLEITSSATTKDIYINQNAMPIYSGLTAGDNQLYRTDPTGVTADTDGEWIDGAKPLYINYAVEHFAGKRIWIMADLQAASATTLYVAAGCWPFDGASTGPTDSYTIGPYRPIATATNDTPYLIGPVRLPQPDIFSIDMESQVRLSIAASLIGYVATSTLSVTVDWYQLLVDRVCWVKRGYSSTGTRVRGSKGKSWDTKYVEAPPVLGDIIELTPNQINHLAVFIFEHGDAGSEAATFVEIQIVPRWLIA